MNKLKSYSGKEGVEVSLFKTNNKFVIKARGKIPAPRIYRTSGGVVYGIERAGGPTGEVEIEAINANEAIHKTYAIFKNLEEMTSPVLPPPIPEPELPTWVTQLASSTPQLVNPQS